MGFMKKNKNKCNRIIFGTFILLAIVIVVFVLFKYPMQGVADQGDFDRVMSSSGLSLLDSDKADSNFIRFYSYIVTNYKISWSPITIIQTIAGSSIGYLIAIVSGICTILGSDVFKTQYLAVAYSTIYIFALLILLKNLNIKSKFRLGVVGIILLFIFLDGNYLIWFNSLYGEPMMIITCMLFIAAYLNYINYKYNENNQDKILSKVVYVFIAAFLFLGSKMQVLSTLPFILILLVKVIIDNKKLFTKATMITLSIILVVICIYPICLNKFNGNISKDTQYNSVFYGVLNGSETPEQDLIDMGLNPDMASEAGKHSYLNKEDYVKYVPRTEITEEEFYSKMSNMKLVKFYLTHPMRLIAGMEYTANKAFITSTSLGKCSVEYSEESVTELNRFTLWSNFRENYLPAHLWFIIGVYVLVFAITIYSFIRNKANELIKNKIILFWGIIMCGAIQFPMPFMANGRADTAKQLFLFNFVFDIILAVGICWVIFKAMDMFKSKLKIKKGR